MKVIILNGAISSGKTTIGKLLAEKLTLQGKRSIFFDLDDLVEKRSPNFTWHTEDERLQDWTDARKELAEITNRELLHGKTVIVVGPFFNKDELKNYTKHLIHSVNVFLFTLIVPLEERLKRNHERKYSNPEEDVVKQQKEITNLHTTYGFDIDNTQSFEKTLEKILQCVTNNTGLL